MAIDLTALVREQWERGVEVTRLWFLDEQNVGPLLDPANADDDYAFSLWEEFGSEPDELDFSEVEWRDVLPGLKRSGLPLTDYAYVVGMVYAHIKFHHEMRPRQLPLEAARCDC